MSWNINVSGANKLSTLAAFDAVVNNDSHCEPKQAIKYAALSLVAHMAEEHVKTLRSHGHTNENGENCTVALYINC